jgi:hypothetical protein
MVNEVEFSILREYMLTIVISFWYIVLFTSMRSPYLSLLTNLGLKSTFSDISLATLACSEVVNLVNLFPSFHPMLMFVSLCKVGFF